LSGENSLSLAKTMLFREKRKKINKNILLTIKKLENNIEFNLVGMWLNLIF